MTNPPEPHLPTGAPDPLGGLDVAAKTVTSGFADLLDAVLALRSCEGDPTEALVGLTLHEHLTLHHRLPGWLAGQLASVADRWDAIPGVAGAYRAGVIAFDNLAGFVRTTRQLHGDLLKQVDEEAASLADRHARHGLTGGWLTEVQMLVEDLRAPGWASREERRASDGMTASIQTDFDGGGVLIATLDRVALPTVAGALDAASDDATADRRQGRAHGLVAVCEAYLTADDGIDGTGSRPARPTMHIVIDLATATTDRFARLLRTTGGTEQLPTLSARLSDTLAANAELLVQIVDGARPLAELRATDTIPASVRRAVLARDGGCRFPTCTAPLRTVHVHHIVHQEHGGTHDPDNLVAACAMHHLRHVHRHGWTPTLDPTTAAVNWSRPGVASLTTLPQVTTARARLPDTSLPPWLAPPIPPPPQTAPPVEPDPPPDHRPPPPP